MPISQVYFDPKSQTIKVKKILTTQEEVAKAYKESVQAGPASVEDPEMTPEYKALQLIGESLGKDTTTRHELCPKCGGGESKEKGFSLSKDTHGYLYWRCFRASCGYRGSTGGGSKGKRTASREAKVLSDPVIALTEDQTDYFSDEYGVDSVRNNLYYVPTQDAFAFKIKASSGGGIGWQLRWFDGRKPKCKSYPEVRTMPFMGWWGHTSQKGLVVVEDPLSAMKVASVGGTHSVALLGTHMSHEHAYCIREHSAHLILALDKGTLDLALSYRDKFADLFEKITIWTLDKDLKYVTRERISAAIAKNATDFITNR